MTASEKICDCCQEPGGNAKCGFRVKKTRGKESLHNLCRWCEKIYKQEHGKERRLARAAAHVVIDTKRVLVASDWHVPYHHAENVAALCDFALDFRPHHFVNAGDFLDFDTLSRHNAGSVALLEGKRTVEHFAVGNAVNDQIDEALGEQCTEKDFLAGNHERRTDSWINRGDNAVWLGDPLIDWSGRLMLQKRGYRVQKDYVTARLQIGRLHIIHGKYHGIHAAHQHVQKLGVNVMFGHTHRSQVYLQPTLDGQRGGYAIGGLADYAQPELQYIGLGSGWSEGFGIAIVRKSGNFQADCLNFIDGVFYWGGKEYGKYRTSDSDIEKPIRGAA